MLSLPYFRRAALVGLITTSAGCVGLGTVGTLGSLAELVRTLRPGDQPTRPVQITAEVQRVEPRRQVIQVQTPDGRAGGVAFDLQTSVLHEGQPFPITGLGPGDLIDLHVLEVAQNSLYASRIEVVRLVSGDAADDEPRGEEATRTVDHGVEAEDDRRGEPERPTEGVVEEAVGEPDPPVTPRRLSGEIGAIDRERGRFLLARDGQSDLEVSLPYNPTPAISQRFRQLQPGDTVRIEAEQLRANRFELRDFLRADEDRLEEEDQPVRQPGADMPDAAS